MLCGNNYLRETLGGSGRDNETPRDLGVSFPRSKGVSSLELELAAVVRISFPFSLLLLFPLFAPPDSGDGGEGDLLEHESHCQPRAPAAMVLCSKCNSLSSAAACSPGQGKQPAWGLRRGDRRVLTQLLVSRGALSLLDGASLSPDPEQRELYTDVNLMPCDSRRTRAGWVPRNHPAVDSLEPEA